MNFTLPPINLEMLVAVGGAVFVAGPMYLAYRARAPRPADNGGVVLRDQEDTGLGLLMSLPGYALVFAIGVGGAVAAYFIGGLDKVIDARGYHGGPEGVFLLLFALIFALVAVGTVYALLKQLWTMTRLAPGELHAPVWPLPGGEVVKLGYTRGLRGEATLNGLSAQLVLYRVVRETRTTGSGSNRSTSSTTVRRVQQTIVLDDGKARVSNGQLEAGWEVEVPTLPPNPMGQFGKAIGTIFDVLDRLPVSLPMGEIAPRLEWQLEVQADFEGLPDDDSVFPLVIGDGALTGRVPRAEQAESSRSRH